MSSYANASPDNIELSSVLSAIKHSLRRILLTSAVLASLTFAVLSMIAPRYQSESELAITAKNSGTTFNDPRVNQAPDMVTTKMDREAINTHVRSMQSTDLLMALAKDLELAEKPEFNSALGPVDALDGALRMIGIGGPRSGESERDRVMTALKDRLEVYSAKESRFIGVRASSSDPQLAADLANQVSETYRTMLASQSVSEIDDQQTVLNGKIVRLNAELLELETEVERYRGEINIFKGGSQNTGLNEQQLSELTAELTRAKAARGEAVARAKSAREMMKLGSADALPDVQKAPLIQNLVQQRVRIERQISELSATLLPGHPRMRQLSADLAGLKRQLNSEIAKVVDSLEKEAKVAIGRETSITRSLDELKSSVVSNAPQEAKLRQLESNTKAKQDELANLRAQLEANRKKLDTRAQPVEAKVISMAQASSVPVFPKKGAMSALMFVASMLIGMAWTVTRALFQGARTPPTSVQAGTLYQPEHRLPRGTAASTAAVADRLTAAKSLEDTVNSSPSQGAETTIASLAARIAAKRPADGGHRTIITGETDSVEADSEAIDLAKVLAAQGRTVVIVDWSPNGDGLSRRLKLGNDAGLTELLLGRASFEDAVARLPGTSAHLISSGVPLRDVEDELEPDQLNLVLDALDEAYEHIIVAGAHEDARMLFEVIQGRFDAAIVVCEQPKRVSVLGDPEGTFLGFEVTDMDVIRFDRPSLDFGSRQRVVRAAARDGEGASLN